jgi:hypothetical protein
MTLLVMLARPRPIFSLRRRQLHFTMSLLKKAQLTMDKPANVSEPMVLPLENSFVTAVPQKQSLEIVLPKRISIEVKP